MDRAGGGGAAVFLRRTTRDTDGEGEEVDVPRPIVGEGRCSSRETEADVD